MSESCRFEAEILHAAAEDRWSPSLRAHLAGCENCTQAAMIAPWMDRFARISDREHILPDPSIVWLKARLLQGSADATRVSRPLDVVQIVAYIVVAGGWAALLSWRWAAIRNWLSAFTPTELISHAARTESLSMSFFSLVFVLASFTVMLALHTILAEDV